ncbi:MAG: hypothetical protein K2F90_03785 [Clostridiales bacterium]|nr:hypothetical protein [Clostridiales bacterium]
MKNVSHSPVTEMLSGKYKILLLIGLAILPIADFTACITLWVMGAAGAYWALPLVMTIGDVLYLIAVVLSNQRFKYALKLFVVYVIFTVICIIIWLASFANSSSVILNNTTLSAWALLHVVGVLAVGVAYLYASRRVRVGRNVQLVSAILLSGIVLLALALFYGGTIIDDGYFGQGYDNLPLVYNYIDDDECEVTDVVYGRGDSIVVPYEFNGRKVKEVSSKIFTYPNIKRVTLNCAADTDICLDAISSGLNTDITIFVDKSAVDVVKQKLYNAGFYGDFYSDRHELGNNVKPIGLDSDEVYVTFNYDRDSYDNAKENIIPTWFGKKGDTFRLSDVKGVDYVAHSDIESDEDLYYSYKNVGSVDGGYIMSPIKYGDRALNGATITESRDVSVGFQKIYKIFAGESNDGKYDTDTQFPFAEINGRLQDYKLTVLDNADKILQSFDRGSAFTRTMQYAAYNSGVYRNFTSLADVLREGYGEVTIAPYWELVKPQITLSRVGGVDGVGVYYGDNYELTATVTHPIDGASIQYEWYDGVENVGITQNLRRYASNAGLKSFTAIVRVSAPQITTCESIGSADITVSLLKRPINVTWSMTGGGDVYDGKARLIKGEVENSAEGETVLLYTITNNGNAGTYTTHAEFVNATQANNYTIVRGSSYTYTIKPHPVALTWDEQTEFTYDNGVHRPTAHALDLDGEELQISYSNIAVNAGDYTTTASLLNSNYVIDDASKKTMNFTIMPQKVSVIWTNDKLTYNGERQAPMAVAFGVGPQPVAISVSGGQTNANVINGSVTTPYIAIAVSTNKNYTLINNTTCSFTIEPYGVTVNWSDTTVTYNGRRQTPTATAVGVSSQSVPVAVSIENNPLGAIDAGTYAATATVADSNYEIKTGGTHGFLINKATVNVQWSNTTLTYNGTEQVPTATAKGVNSEDLPLTVSGGRRNVGSGTATAAFASEQQNYTLTNTTTSFTVEKKRLYIGIHVDDIEYGQTPHYTHEITGLVEGDDVTVSSYQLTCIHKDDEIIPVGQHFVTAVVVGTDRGNYEIVITVGVLNVTAPPEQTEE